MSNAGLDFGHRGTRRHHLCLDRMRSLAFIALVVAAGPGVATAQQSTAAVSASRVPKVSPPPRTMRAVRRKGPITLDGKLDEPAWAAAPVSSDFVESYPAPNAKAPDRTEVRVLYDEDALYVGVRM